MPVEIRRCRRLIGVNGLARVSTVDAEQPLGRRRMPADAVGDEDPAIGRQTPPTEIEELMVQDAQGQTVRGDVRPAGLHPFDVGRLQTDGLAPEGKIEPASGTPVLVSQQDELAESRVASAIGPIGFD